MLEVADAATLEAAAPRLTAAGVNRNPIADTQPGRPHWVLRSTPTTTTA